MPALALAASRDVLDRAGYGAPKGEEPSKGDRTLIINVLGTLSQQQRREIGLGLLTGSNGNGHGPA